MDLGNRLKQRRRCIDKSGGQVALRLEISTAHLSDIENGKKKPSLNLLKRLATYYETSTDYLLGLTDDPTPKPNISLPEHGSEMLELMHDLSDRISGELMEIARILHRLDVNQRQYEVLSDIYASLFGEESLEAINNRLTIRAAELGSMRAAIAELLASSDESTDEE